MRPTPALSVSGQARLHRAGAFFGLERVDAGRGPGRERTLRELGSVAAGRVRMGKGRVCSNPVVLGLSDTALMAMCNKRRNALSASRARRGGRFLNGLLPAVGTRLRPYDDRAAAVS